MLVNEEIIKNFFKDSFLVWEPKDIVGGDIYFVKQINQDEMIVVFVDCTGHGVAGAMVTMIVKTIEDDISAKMDREGLLSPSEILKTFNQRMKQIFESKDDESFNFAGFDGAVLYINKNKGLIKAASAKTPLFLISKNKELKIIKGDKVSVAYKNTPSEYEFEEHSINTNEYNKLYVSTDGYWDQLGGENEFSLGKKAFEKTILENCEKPFFKQKELLMKKFHEYKDDIKQVDDICLFAFKL